MLDLGLGLVVENARTICMVEREAYCVEVLSRRMEEGLLDSCPVWTDVVTFNGRPWRGVVDIVTAGFSCQPWSKAGRRMGTDDERWIWPDIARIVREVEPGYVFIENVTGLVSGGGIAVILGGLDEMGFDAEWAVFAAAEAGAPQRRERLFLLAVKRDGVVNPMRIGCIPQEHDESAGWPSAAAAGGEIHGGSYRIFPPIPNDYESWGRVPHRLQPALEPEVHGMADGSSDRMGQYGTVGIDELRALGNGVVPHAAAVAFVTLFRRLQHD